MSVFRKALPLASGGLSALAMIAMLGVGVAGFAMVRSSGPASAQGHDEGGGGGQGPGPGSTGGGGSGGHETGGHEGGGHSGGGGSGGQGLGGEPHGTAGETAGGRPPWAAEGIPEVELGRLNVARSPEQVIARAHAEALVQLPAMSAFYNLSLSEMIAALQNNWDSLVIIDSPLQNLALFRDALDGQIELSAYGIDNDRTTLMAVFVGVATDKTVPVTTETVQALSIIMGMPVALSEASAIATAAEAVRQAVVQGHG